MIDRQGTSFLGAAGTWQYGDADQVGLLQQTDMGCHGGHWNIQYISQIRNIFGVICQKIQNLQTHF